jgi:hypothetical protein
VQHVGHVRVLHAADGDQGRGGHGVAATDRDRLLWGGSGNIRSKELNHIFIHS